MTLVATWLSGIERLQTINRSAVNTTVVATLHDAAPVRTVATAAALRDGTIQAGDGARLTCRSADGSYSTPPGGGYGTRRTDGIGK